MKVEVAAQDDQTKYALGSVLNHAAASDCGGQGDTGTAGTGR